MTITCYCWKIEFEKQVNATCIYYFYTQVLVSKRQYFQWRVKQKKKKKEKTIEHTCYKEGKQPSKHGGTRVNIMTTTTTDDNRVRRREIAVVTKRQQQKSDRLELVVVGDKLIYNNENKKR